MNDQDMRKIFLAGPTVFFREAGAAFAGLERLCRERELNPVRPAEPVDSLGHALSGVAAARYLFDQNTLRIRTAAGVLADLRPFTGELWSTAAP